MDEYGYRWNKEGNILKYEYIIQNMCEWEWVYIWIDEWSDDRIW